MKIILDEEMELLIRDVIREEIKRKFDQEFEKIFNGPLSWEKELEKFIFEKVGQFTLEMMKDK